MYIVKINWSSKNEFYSPKRQTESSVYNNRFVLLIFGQFIGNIISNIEDSMMKNLEESQLDNIVGKTWKKA